MKERPIIFSGESVRAILAGAKTQTRRLIPEAAIARAGSSTGGLDPVPGPYEVGGRLRVRETWGINQRGDATPNGKPYDPSVVYQATDDSPSGYSLEKQAIPWRWRSPIFMPHRASRIDLEITDVRVQRLQDITEDDARAECVITDEEYAERAGEQAFPACPYCEGWGVHVAINPATLGATEVDCAACDTILKRFAILWDTINGKRECASWECNPWVLVIEFRRVKLC